MATTTRSNSLSAVRQASRTLSHNAHILALGSRAQLATPERLAVTISGKPCSPRHVSRLEACPNEIKLEIASHLWCDDLSRLIRTSKYLYTTLLPELTGFAHLPINTLGMLPIHLAAMNGSKLAVKALLENHRVAIDAREANFMFQYTALHYAAIMNNADMIKFLVAHGANLNLLTNCNQSALMLAESLGVMSRRDALKALLNSGARIDYPRRIRDILKLAFLPGVHMKARKKLLKIVAKLVT